MAERAKHLSDVINDQKYLFTYSIQTNKRKSQVIVAKTHDEAKRKFETSFPTAKVTNILNITD